MGEKKYIGLYYHFQVYLYDVVLRYSTINYTKSPASGVGDVSEPRLISQAEKCAKSCSCRSVCSCSESGEDVSVHIVT
jgi:hypothetical protein